MELKKLLYRYGEAAQLLGVSVRHIRRLVDEGKLERVFIGKTLHSARITASSIERYVAELVRRNGSILNPA